MKYLRRFGFLLAIPFFLPLLGCPLPERTITYGPCTVSAYRALVVKDSTLLTIEDKDYVNRMKIECEHFRVMHRPEQRLVMVLCFSG